MSRSKIDRIFIQFLFLFVALDVRSEPIQYLNHALQNLNHSVPKSTECAWGENCPTVLTELLSHAKENKGFASLLPFIGDKSPREQCERVQLEGSGFNDGVALERFLELNTNYASSILPSLSQQNCFAKLSDKDQLSITGLRYVAEQRLTLGLGDDIEALANVDRVLQKGKVAAEIDCRDLTSDQLKSKCKEAKSCSQPTYSLDDMAERGAYGFKLIEEKQNRLADIVRTSGLILAKKNPEAMQLEHEIQQIRQIYPWLAGDKVKSSYLNMKRATTQGELLQLLKTNIANDLSETRRKIIEKYQNESLAMNCLRGVVSEGSQCNKFYDTVSLSLKLPTHKEKPESKNEIYARNELSQAQCLFDMTQNRKSVEHELNRAALDVTVATALALTPYAIVQVAKLTSRAGAVGALVVNGAADVSYLGLSVSDAYQSCDSNLQEQILESQGKIQCQKNTDEKYLSAHFEFESCALSVLAGVASLVPLGTFIRAGRRLHQKAPGIKINQKDLVAKNFKLSDLERRAAIKNQFPNYSSEQVDAVMRAHEVGGSPYTSQELKQKIKIMSEAKITKADREVILRSGLAGRPGRFTDPYRPKALHLVEGQMIVGNRVLIREQEVMVPRTGGYSVGQTIGPDSAHPERVVVEFMTEKGLVRKSVLPSELMQLGSNTKGVGREIQLNSREFLTPDGAIYERGERVMVNTQGVFHEVMIEGPGQAAGEISVYVRNSVTGNTIRKDLPKSQIFSPFEKGDEVLIPGPEPGPENIRDFRWARITEISDESDIVKVEIKDRFRPGRHGYKEISRSELRYMEGYKAPGVAAYPNRQLNTELEAKAKLKAKDALKDVDSNRAEQVNRARNRDAWQRRLNENPNDEKAKAQLKRANEAYKLTEERILQDQSRAYHLYKNGGGSLSESEFLGGSRP